jgi:hypothetical protein
MVQVIHARQPSQRRSKSQQIGEALSRGALGVTDYLTEKNKKQENELRSEKAFTEVEQLFSNPDLSPEQKQIGLFKALKDSPQLAKELGSRLAGLQESSQKREEMSSKLKGEQQEKLAPFEGALDVINEMRSIRERGNLGMLSKAKGFINEDTRRDRGEYARLGKSIISLASNIPIRNRQEFETLAEDLYDPSITDAEAEGILNAMEHIIQNNMRNFQPQEGNEIDLGTIKIPTEPSARRPESKSKKRPLTSFFK